MIFLNPYFLSLKASVKQNVRLHRECLTLRHLDYVIVYEAEPLVAALYQRKVVPASACVLLNNDPRELISYSSSFFVLCVRKPTQKPFL